MREKGLLELPTRHQGGCAADSVASCRQARNASPRRPVRSGFGFSNAIACACALALGLGAVRSARAAGPEPGTVLGPSTASQATGLLPPEFLGRYEKGEWSHAVATPKPGTNLLDPDWIAAGKENAGKFTVNEQGSIRDVKTDVQPQFIWGPPFPNIDPKDPNAGVKVAWNFFYQSYLIGDDRNLVELTWVSPTGTDRQLKTEVLQKFYDGQKPFRLPKENPLNLLYQQFVQVKYPADLEGTVALAWRYRDDRRDSNWAYSPAIRRVRNVSPTNRSDGSFGSDMSQDDGSYFDGKPEDFNWKLVGEGEQLFLVDKGSVVDGKDNLAPVPGGGWRIVYDDKPRFNFLSPEWQKDQKGLAWAPLPNEFVLIKRPVWFVEVTPKDRYYLYGKIMLAFDKETWYGTYSSKFDWQGNLLNSYLPLHGAWFKKGDDYRGSSSLGFTMSQNFKLNRATVSFTDASDKTVPSDTLITLGQDQFDVNALTKSGR
jgi:hypothetical protein